LVLWGVYSFSRLPIDALPDITNNQVQIITTSPTLAAQEVEKFITYPIEQAVKPIPKIVELRSISRFGLSVVTVVFEEDVDIYWARTQIRAPQRSRGQHPPRFRNARNGAHQHGFGRDLPIRRFPKARF
jgi:cobalt-zinc-cadmium resistance protein CzcA